MTPTSEVRGTATTPDRDVRGVLRGGWWTSSTATINPSQLRQFEWIGCAGTDLIDGERRSPFNLRGSRPPMPPSTLVRANAALAVVQQKSCHEYVMHIAEFIVIVVSARFPSMRIPGTSAIAFNELVLLID